MELSFSQLRTKEVVNTQDGRKLGKVCDVVLCYPENKWLGIVVPNGKVFGLKRSGLFIDLRHIVKIGDDVILVNVSTQKKHGDKQNDCPPPNPPHDPCCPPRRNFEEYE